MSDRPAVSGRPEDSRPRRWPWLVAAVVLVAGAADPLLAMADAEAAGPHPLEAVALALVLMGCLGSSALLLSRGAVNPVAWLLPLPAVYLGLGGVAEVMEYLGADQLLLWTRVVRDASWAASFPSLAIFLPLLFPTGRLPSHRWRWAARMGGASVVLLVLGNALNPDLIDGNPMAVGGPLPIIALTVGGPLFLVSLATSAGAAVVRYRRAHGVERQQLRWFVRAAALVVPAWIVAILLEGGRYERVGTMLLAATIGLLPVAVAIAVLRYRLYDIDRVVSRTVAWTLLSLLLAGVYGGTVLGAQALLGGDVPDVVIALATLAVAALFQPLRGRVQRLVDRRFNRSRYDAEATVAAFGVRLRDQFAPDHVRDELVIAARGAVAPRSISLWMP